MFACRLSLHLVDGSLHDIELCRRGANPELSRNTREDLAASTRRCGIARLLKRFPKKMGTGSAARRQHARKLAVEARWTAMERDKDNMRTPGSISDAIHGVTYLVPDSLGGACKGRALEQRQLGARGLLPPAGLFGSKSAAIICDSVASAMGVPGSADEDDDGDDEVHNNYPTYDSGDESDDVFAEYGLDVEPYFLGHVACGQAESKCDWPWVTRRRPWQAPLETACVVATGYLTSPPQIDLLTFRHASRP